MRPLLAQAFTEDTLFQQLDKQNRPHLEMEGGDQRSQLPQNELELCNSPPAQPGTSAVP